MEGHNIFCHDYVCGMFSRLNREADDVVIRYAAFDEIMVKATFYKKFLQFRTVFYCKMPQE